MSDIDRLFQLLVRTIQTSFPAYLNRPFEVAELYQNILPYRHHRRELGFETNQDYELALTQLLAGAGGYLVVDDRMRDTLQRELASRNPDPGTFREFAASQVSLNPDAVTRVLGEGAAGARTSSAPRGSASEQRTASQPTATAAPAASAPATPSAAPAANASPASAMSSGAPASPSSTSAARAGSAAQRPALTPSPPRMSTPVATSRPAQQGITPAAGESCRYCGGALPPGRRIVFCPHCGQNLTIVNCPACGTELELGWKFCTTCGRPSSAS